MDKENIVKTQTGKRGTHMTDIELVIKIPEKIYESSKRECEENPKLIIDTFTYAIGTGTPLPKGHGDLIDKSKIYKAIPAEEDNLTGAGMTFEEMDAYNDGIDSMYSLVKGARPIIEADKENRNERGANDVANVW